MKKRKELAVVALSVLLASSIAGQALAAKGFQDLEGVKNADAIVKLQEKGIVSGVSEGVFAPAEKLTAAQAATLIIKGMDLNFDTIRFVRAPLASDYFTSVDDNAWFAQSFVIAHFYGIEFPADIDPNKPLTREQFAFFLQQGVEKVGNYPLVKMYINIGDESDMTTSYQGAIQRSLLMKITSLDEAGNFHPKAEITREEAAAMLYNAVTFVESHTSIPESPEPTAESSSAPITTPAPSATPTH
ncbi:S-layer homology domain-containing protein [Gorillibacterium massiliense]|uniref:S-layer homology domain-containing protein n=1 Tax=Gorillibacterium massiliense TaxID=1280390 RepID=UPI0004B3018F|nr:S-layer homology domain-containing protein [Gorillibacterium massiliense]